MTRLRQSSATLTDVQRAHLQHRKTCAAVTCGEVVVPGRVFCPNHWFFLPKWLRASIIATFADAEWDAHQDAIRQGADHIDAATVVARAAGFSGVISARDGAGDVVRFQGREVQ